MRSWLVMIMAVALATAAASVTGVRLARSAPSPHVVVHAQLPPKLASYFGVFEPGAPPSYAAIASFTKKAGKQPNLLGYYSGWAEPFDTQFADMIHKHGLIPFVQIDPTDAVVAGIADGTYDDYLRSYADSVQDYGHNVVIGFGHEMNAPWYSWGYGHVKPATFVAAWRHIVTLFDQEGAQNVTWLWTIQADEPGTGPIAAWWPGKQFVTWVGIDGYYAHPSDSFTSVFVKTIGQVRTFTSQPVLLSETAVGLDDNPFVNIANLFNGMAAYRTLGLVWFDKDQHGSAQHQDWRIEDDPTGLPSFVLGVSTDLAATLPAG
jgi:hypothetical protein